MLRQVGHTADEVARWSGDANRSRKADADTAGDLTILKQGVALSAVEPGHQEPLPAPNLAAGVTTGAPKWPLRRRSRSA